MTESDKQSAISVLEKQAGILQILVYLYEKQNGQKVNIAELVSNIKASRETIGKSIKYLSKVGLLMDEYTKTFPVQHFVWLTHKGRCVAKGQVDSATELQNPKI